jgi:HK97 family phage portal protein
VGVGTGLVRWLGYGEPELQRNDPSLSFDEWGRLLTSFAFNGVNYTLPTQSQEPIDPYFPVMARLAYKANAVVYACIQNRIDLFSEARFTFRRLRSSRPSGLFANPDLRVLETPWTGATTGDLLGRMLLYHDIAGNAYVVRRGDTLAVLRPDWVTIIGGVKGNKEATTWNVDAQVLGYAYQEGGPSGGKDPVIYMPEEVAHFASKADPEARFRGMSPLTPAIQEIMADKAATTHKLKFFENGATPNLIVKLDVQDLEIYKKWIEQFKKEHAGVHHAYDTMFLGAGADATVVGTNLEQLDFKVTQGAGETRIAAVLGVPPVVVGLSEGLAAATYSNYQQARRRFADQTIRPLWRNVCGSLQNIISTPPDAQLWYDDRDIAALSEDAADIADIQTKNAQSIKALIDAGFNPDDAVAAIEQDDLTLLQGNHSGLFSVQLQPAGSVSEGKGSLVQGVVVPAPNGNGNGNQPANPPAPPVREEPLQLTIHMPDIHNHPPHVDVHAPITVEPVRFDENAIRVEIEAAPAPEVVVQPAEVTVHLDKHAKRKLMLPSGERATIREGEATEIEFEDGRTATFSDLPE